MSFELHTKVSTTSKIMVLAGLKEMKESQESFNCRQKLAPKIDRMLIVSSKHCHLEQKKTSFSCFSIVNTWIAASPRQMTMWKTMHACDVALNATLCCEIKKMRLQQFHIRTQHSSAVIHVIAILMHSLVLMACVSTG